MAWIITFNQDTETYGVGTATANYTDVDGKTLVNYSSYVDTKDDNTISQFIDNSLAKLQKQLDINTEINSLLAKIQAVLNAKTGG